MPSMRDNRGVHGWYKEGNDAAVGRSEGMADSPELGRVHDEVCRHLIGDAGEAATTVAHSRLLNALNDLYAEDKREYLKLCAGLLPRRRPSATTSFGLRDLIAALEEPGSGGAPNLTIRAGSPSPQRPSGRPRGRPRKIPAFPPGQIGSQVACPIRPGADAVGQAEGQEPGSGEGADSCASADRMTSKGNFE